MKEKRESIIPLPPNWDPEKTAEIVQAEVEKWWNEGWVLLTAEPDRLFESVCLYFERTLD